MKDGAVLSMLLKQLKLPIMSRLCEGFNQESLKEGWTPTHFLKVLCEHELAHRESRKLSRNMSEAKLPRGKSLAAFDFSAAPSLNKNQIYAFGLGDIWIKGGKNLLIFGPSGVGKTHLAAGIGERLVESGYRVFFTKATELIQKLQIAKKECQLSSALDKLNKYDCLILDDMGYVKKDHLETSVLFELISERYENKSLLITCNQPFAEWDQIFIDQTMAIAAVDRLIHHAAILEMNNIESYRWKTATSKALENKKIELKK